MHRRLRLEDAPHARVWEISVEGEVITVRSGAEHSPGTVRRIPFATADQARKTAEQLLTQRLADGFRDAPVEAWENQLGPSSSDAEWLVFADSLLARGDATSQARAELIGAHLRGEAKRAKALLRRHADALLGDLAAFTNQVELTWQRGFIVSAHLNCEPRRRHAVPLADLVTALMGSPSVRGLRRLRLGHPGKARRYDEAVERLGVGEWPPFLDTVDLGLGADDETSLSSLKPLQRRGTLKYLAVRTALTELPRLRHLGLRHVELDVPTLSHAVLTDLLESDLPALRGLVLNVGFDGALTARHLTPLASTRFLPGLVALGIRRCRDVITFVERLAGGGRLAKLTLLDLKENRLNERDGRWLVEHADELAHLTRLDLRDNALKPRIRVKLRAALASAETDSAATGRSN